MNRSLAVIWILVLLAPAAAGAQEADAPTVTVGFARLYLLESVTVVYPASPEEAREGNRISAVLRAGHLRRTHGIEARILSDLEATDAPPDDHLLVLGWNNRLLSAKGATPPFRMRGGGVEFLGLKLDVDDGDLAFVHASPFHDHRLLFFWSRIDPELDRHRILPSTGSDWAVYHVYRAVAQGMFVDGATLPPRRNPDAQIDRRESIRAWKAALETLSTARYDIHYDPQVLSRAGAEAVARARESAFRKAEDSLGKAPERFRIDLYVYRDTEQKVEMTEAKGPVHSVPGLREMHMTPRYARSASSHEEINVLARERFGPASHTAIYDGLPFSFERIFQGKDLDLHAALMLDQGVLPTLEDLLDEETLREIPNDVQFPSSGLLMSWIRSAAVSGALSRAYTLRGAGVADLAAALGLESGAAEAAFLAYVRERAALRQEDLAFLKALMKARDLHLAGDYRGIAGALERALELRPGDPEVLFNLAAARMRTGEYEAAERDLLSVLESDLPDNHRLTVFGHYQLGRLYDIQGRRAAALERYRRVLALPDIHDSHRSAREGLEIPFTRDRLE